MGLGSGLRLGLVRRPPPPLLLELGVHRRCRVDDLCNGGDRGAVESLELTHLNECGVGVVSVMRVLSVLSMAQWWTC